MLERIIIGQLTQKDGEKVSKYHHIVVIDRGNDNSHDTFSNLLVSKLSERFNGRLERVTLDKLTPSVITPNSTVLCTIELHEPILATLSVTEMISLKIMTDNTTNLLWITAGCQIDALRPDLAMVSGF